MKTVIIAPYYHPRRGGMETYTRSVAQGLSDLTDRVSIISTYDKSAQEEELPYCDTVDGNTVYRLPITCMVSNTPIGLRWYSKIREILKQESPDVVNAQTPVPYISDIGARVCRELGIPFVLSYHNDLIKDNPILTLIISGYYRLLGCTTLDLSDRIIASSKLYVDRSPYLRRHRTKTVYIPPGVDDAFISTKLPPTRNQSHSQSAQGKHRMKVLFIGQLDRTHSHKGLHVLLDAIAAIPSARYAIQLTIVGKGDAVDRYKAQIKRLGITNLITFAGFVPDPEMPGIIDSHDVVTLPSLSDAEGFGIVNLEANARAKPVVASQAGGIGYIIRDYQNGLLVPPGNREALASALCILARDPALRKRLGNYGRKIVCNKYQWKQQIKKTYDLLSELI